MKSTDLRQLIKESIQEYIREIDAAGDRAALEAKMKACEEAIALREKKSNMDGLDEAYHDMLDKGKIGELKKEIKALGKTLEKYKKQLAKMDGKNEPKKEKEDKEVIDETPEITAEVDMNEYTADPNAGPELEEADLTPEESEELRKKAEANDKEYSIAEAKKKKMTAAEKTKKEDIVKAMKKSKSFGKSKEEKAKMYATATKLATKESVNEQFLHMQKLAGLITETQYKKKMQMLNEIEIKVGSIYVYEHPKAGPVKVKALGKSEWGDEYFTIEALEDKGEVRKGNQYNAEIEKLTVTS